MSSLRSDKEIIELIDKFFVKSTSLICAAKCSRYHIASDLAPQFDEEWLLSETDEDLELPEIVQEWSGFDGRKDLPPLVVETYLNLRRVDPSQWVTLKDDEGNVWNVCKGTKKSEIVLERWLIELDKNSASFKSHKPTVEESSSFPGQLVLLFRYLYTLIQLLPASDLHAALCKATDVHGVSSPIDVSTRILDGSKPILSKGRIGLSKPIISTYSNVVNESNVPSHLEQRKITPVWTKFGLLRISVSYRHDCRFDVHDAEEENPNNHYISEPTPRRLSANRSPSLSPQARGSSISSMDNPSFQRRPVAISRQLQVFKVGSVGSVPTSQSQMMVRNPSSSSSAVANLQAQRSNNSPIPSSSTIHVHDMNNEGTTVGSASKYSSSFGRIRRHSSTKHSEHAERLIKSNKQQEDQSDALLDFVKLIDEKPELKLSKNRSVTMDISNSLMKFQSLKPTNDFISENLSMSTSMDPSHASQRRRSSSHSPIPSFSPAINYPSIPSRFSQTSLNENPIGSRVSSNEISKEPPDIRRSSLSSNHGSSVSSHRHSTIGKEAINCHQRIRDDGHILHDDDEEEDDALLMNHTASSNFRSRRHSYAKSAENITSSITRNRLPIPQPSQHPQPITTAIPAFAKLHRPGKNAGGSPESDRKKGVSEVNSPPDDEDEDLLFFMSDMSLSKM